MLLYIWPFLKTVTTRDAYTTSYRSDPDSRPADLHLSPDLVAAVVLGVDPVVSVAFVAACERASAGCACERLLAGMGSDVCGEVVAAAEGARADGALEGLLPRVDAQVPRQLVAAGEPSLARLHRAGVGPLVDGGLPRGFGR